jgi:hypothetical protein
MNGKQKGIVGAIAVVALLAAGLVGMDFNPPSQEQYAEQTARVESLTGANSVFWTKSGTSYHPYSDCSYINTVRTNEIFQGTVAQARELKEIGKQEIAEAATLASAPGAGGGRLPYLKR